MKAARAIADELAIRHRQAVYNSNKNQVCFRF